MMKMISRPDGIGKMMKAVQGLARGMSGGGPLFGNKDANQAGTPNMQDMQKIHARFGSKARRYAQHGRDAKKRCKKCKVSFHQTLKKRF